MSRAGKRNRSKSHAVVAGSALDGALSAAGAFVEGERSAGQLVVTASAGAARSAGASLVERGLEAGVRKAMPRVARELARSAGKRTAAQAAKGALRSNALGSIAILVVGQGVDTAQLAAGDIDQKEYRLRSAENVGNAAGSVAGGAVGAAIGTALCPGIGTAVGGWLGSFFGGLAAGSAGRALAS